MKKDLTKENIKEIMDLSKEIHKYMDKSSMIDYKEIEQFI